MGEHSRIEWCHHSFNPWWGCSRVSPACRFCYADRDAKRYGHAGLWRRHGPRRLMSDGTWNNPVKWNRAAERAGTRARVFCASMADVFEPHPDVVDARGRLWDLVEATPWLDWLLLTKRPEHIAELTPWGSTGWPGNVWLGVSAELQRWADERIPLLVEYGAPAAVRFVSAEPVLGLLDLTRWTSPQLVCGCGGCPGGGAFGCCHECMRPERVGLDWVIAGGESGAKARPSHPDWFRSLRDQCGAGAVAFHFKQWGEWMPVGAPHDLRGADPYDGRRVLYVDPADGSTQSLGDWKPGDRGRNLARVVRVGKRQAGRELDGRTWDGLPTARPGELVMT